ncbi:probable L-ascorbate peroxidase 6, chloroplastic [Jatropha curcas]|uniref:L-ascorbate peroxidase n=1 Tax=Jatropha curcas TaxID=180498 RepID=U3PT35_JATCU|nr:probable L-ascorbate peroxidase 6, chloroplastic [Jatropha curcas]AGW52121.1 thylakoidal ascorbate peroxidase [Jatropha curcas]
MADSLLHLQLSPSSPMASLSGAASSRLLPSASRARIAFHSATSSSSLSPLSLSSSSSSYSFSPLKCLRSSPLVPRVFFNKTVSAMSTVTAASDPAQLKSAREDIKELLKSTFCHPILVRLGWHDAGLVNALKLLQPIKDKYSGVTYADLFQLASATAIEEAGGPKLPMKYGRVDVSAPEDCPEEGRLPSAGPPSPADHLREVFYRMGLNDKEIVALSGAHTLGRSRPDRSGWGKPETKYTKNGPGAPGGQSWTVEWLKFDNSYFKDIKAKKDEDLLVLPTDAVLFDDPSFRVYAEKYAEDKEAFFKDYAEAHAKLSNLGAKFDPPEGIVLDGVAGEKFVAAKYSTGKRELSDAMKQKIRAEYEAVGGSPDKPLQSNYFLNIMIVIAVLAILTSLLGN